MPTTESANPFPGMNPFVESPAEWPDMHDAMVVYARSWLNDRLPETYRAKTTETVYIESVVRRQIRADVMVVGGGRFREDAPIVRVPVGKGLDEPFVIEVEDVEVPDKYVEIICINQPEEVVCAIEFISSSNKTTGRGREEYEKKQSQLLQSYTHLIEVDLIRAHLPVVAVPQMELDAFVTTETSHARYDYIVCLHRARSGARFEVWPFTVRERMPVIAVPLLEDDPDVPLDLQTVFDQAFETGGFRVGGGLYERDLIPRLSSEDAAWADNILRSRGLR